METSANRRCFFYNSLLTSELHGTRHEPRIVLKSEKRLGIITLTEAHGQEEALKSIEYKRNERKCPVRSSSACSSSYMVCEDRCA